MRTLALRVAAICALALTLGCGGNDDGANEPDSDIAGMVTLRVNDRFEELNYEEARTAAEDELDWELLAPAELPGGYLLELLDVQARPQGSPAALATAMFHYSIPGEPGTGIRDVSIEQRPPGQRLNLTDSDTGPPTPIGMVPGDGATYTVYEQGSGFPLDSPNAVGVYAALPEPVEGNSALLYTIVLNAGSEPDDFDLASLVEDVLRPARRTLASPHCP